MMVVAACPFFVCSFLMPAMLFLCFFLFGVCVFLMKDDQEMSFYQ